MQNLKVRKTSSSGGPPTRLNLTCDADSEDKENHKGVLQDLGLSASVCLYIIG